MLSLLLGTGSAVARELETQAIKDRLASIESYLQEDRLRSAKVAIASAQEGLSIIQHSTGMREMNLVSLATHLRAAYIDIQGAIYQTKIQSRFFGLSKKIVPYLERTNRLRCALMLGAINQLEHAIYETLGDDGLLMQLAEKREKNADAIDEVTKDNLRVDLWNNSLSEIENLSGRERLECVKKKAGAWQKKMKRFGIF